LKDDLYRFFNEFHHNSKLTKRLNTSFISLILKIDSPRHLSDFHPTALMGCLYKIMSKVRASRLLSVVSESQSAFIKERQILDGILISNELVHDDHHFKKGLFLFKVDFEKGYDSVDWGYLEEVMIKMRFSTFRRKWILECVTTTSSSVLVNGSPTNEFKFERGLRQDNPLSPFLFHLEAEGLSVLCNSSFFARIILIIYYVCLYVLVCDYLYVCILLGISGFWSFSDEG